MKKTGTVLAAMAIGAAAIGISLAPSAAGDPSNCQTVGAATVCGQGDVRGGGQSAGAPNVPAPTGAPAGGGCRTPYGTYQNCRLSGG
jgi:hypothetical protein